MISKKDKRREMRYNVSARREKVVISAQIPFSLCIGEATNELHRNEQKVIHTFLLLPNLCSAD